MATIAELKEHSRPRRSPRTTPLDIKPPEVWRGMDVKYEGNRYKVIARSKTHPLTHWYVVPLSEKGLGGKVLTPLDLETSVIVAIRAEQMADWAHLKSFARMTDNATGVGSCTFQRGKGYS